MDGYVWSLSTEKKTKIVPGRESKRRIWFRITTKSFYHCALLLISTINLDKLGLELLGEPSSFSPFPLLHAHTFTAYHVYQRFCFYLLFSVFKLKIGIILLIVLNFHSFYDVHIPKFKTSELLIFSLCWDFLLKPLKISKISLLVLEKKKLQQFRR